MRRHLRLIISGKVQGVYYRQFIYDYVKSSNLRLSESEKITGYVKNLKDKTVEVVIESTEEILEKMIMVCYVGPIKSNVISVKEEWDTEFKDFRDFSIEY